MFCLQPAAGVLQYYKQQGGTEMAETVWRVIGGFVSALLILWGLLPLSAGLFGVGSAAMVVVGAAGVLLSVAFPWVSLSVQHLWQKTAGKWIILVPAILMALLVALFVVVSIFMIAATFSKPSEEATVVVLGAGLYENRPSTILRGRLDAAADYLKEHPQAACIVSGGQGEDELCTEAAVMKEYLLQVGIAPERIYTEEQATSTYENICFSKEIIEENQLNPAMAVVTQEFHQYRAQQFAKSAGFSDVGAVTAHTPWYLLGSYWIRDFAGICHMALLGN